MPRSVLAIRFALFALVAGLLATRADALAPNCSDPAILGTQNAMLVGDFQRHVEAADLNGDRLLDLVVSGQNSIIIALATGMSGGLVSYGAPTSYSTPLGPTGTAIADFNGDGILDIAVACDGGGLVLLRGLGSGGVGNGQFLPYSNIGIGSAWDVAAADINGDGILDLVVALRNGQVLPLIGHGSGGVGDGTFTPGTPANVPGSPKGLVLADLDKDGILDAVVATEGSTVDVLKGNGSGGVGNGTFSSGVSFPSSGTTYDVTVGDFDGDGYPDIASANYTGHSISVLLGGPNLTFRAPITHTAAGNPLGVAAADIDSDGHMDLVVAATSGGSAFSYFHNSGSTSPNSDGFSSATVYGPAKVGYGISIADVNGDHAPDVLVPGITDYSVLVAFNACSADQPRVLTTNVVGSGTVARVPDQPSYTTGTVVQLTANPAPGWIFSNWSGDALGNANPLSVTMDVDRTVVARFIPLQRTVTVAIAGPGHGTVTRTPDLASYDNGSTVRLTAAAEFGSVFAGWSGDASGSANPLDLLVDDDKAVTATFAVDHAIAPRIASITDVPLDQGGRVKVRWWSSSLETTTTNPDTLVTQYFIWREIPQSAFRAASTTGASLTMHTTSAAQDYFWEFVTSLPASRFAGYSYTASTTSDSSALGNPFTSFLVQARNAASTRWFNSDPDSGYSVDNLAPTTPGPVAVNYGASANLLHWRPSVAPDLRGYRLHGGTTSDFVPSAANLVAEVTDTACVDPSPGPRYYRLAAVDVHGNLSPYVLVPSEAQLAVPTGDTELALDGVLPNPSTGEHLTVHLSLPSTAPAMLELLDTTGRRLASRRLEGVAGRQTVALDPDRGLAPGLYWIRLRYAGQEKSTRAVVMQ